MQMIPTIDAEVLADQFPPVRVGDKTINETEIAHEMQHHPAASLEEARESAATGLVIRTLLLAQADELGIATDQDDDARIAALIEQEVDVPAPDEEACRRYFDANPQRFRTPTLLAASHILLPAAPDDAEQRVRQEEMAKALIEQLQSRPERFAELAKDHSACESRKQGGQLGQLSPGQTVDEFERPLWSLPEGLADKPIESRYGWHVVRVDRRVEGEPLPFEAVKGKIREYLLESVTRRAFRQYVQILAMEQGVEGVDLELSGSPLVQ
ncbi:peptidylprolyl isomerase [Marinobacteraceae bacterium S3BR75-40.1]